MTVRRWKAEAPDRRGWRIENAAAVDGDVAELYIYDAIDSWGGYWGVSAGDVVEALSGVKASTLNVHLNSPGGDYFEGVAIYNALRSHSATINVFVDGMAASAASVIAMVGEHVVMGVGAQMMIHEARTIAIGTADVMRAQADLLDKIGDDVAAFYQRKAGGDVATWRAAMKVETWYTADEAVAAGLADEVAGADEQDDPAEPDEPDEREPAAARAAARWVAAWQHPGRAAAPAPKTPAPAAEAVPPASAAGSEIDLSELIRSAVRRDTPA